MINSSPMKASTTRPFNPALLNDPLSGARHLLGAILVRTLSDGTQLIGRIVETEAYHEADPASHTFRGKGSRNLAMFGPPGHAYIYLSYGMHWCFNVTAGQDGKGAGILIRAVEPLEGIEVMRQLRRGITHTTQLTNGPGKVGQALAIDKSLYGHDLSKPPLQLLEGPKVKPDDIITGPRIGISQAVDELLRFYVRDNPYVSRKK
jgi:DNA-3-methyladenine glycosylase